MAKDEEFSAGMELPKLIRQRRSIRATSAESRASSSSQEAISSPHSESDRLVVRRFKQSGESRYFAILFERHKRKIFELAYGYFGNISLAEDIVQETFKRALEMIGSFDEDNEGSNFVSWLRTIAKNSALDWLRKIKIRKEQAHPIGENSENEGSKEIDDLSPDATSYNGTAIRYPQEMQVLFREVDAELAELKEEYRICYLLFYVEGYSYEEIQQITGFTFENVKNYLRAARRALESKFNQSNEPERKKS